MCFHIFIYKLCRATHCLRKLAVVSFLLIPHGVKAEVSVSLTHPISHMTAEQSLSFMRDTIRASEVISSNDRALSTESNLFLSSLMSDDVKAVEPYAVAYNHLDKGISVFRSCPSYYHGSQHNSLYAFYDPHNNKTDAYWVGPYVVYRLAKINGEAFYHAELFNLIPKEIAENYESKEVLQNIWRTSIEKQYRTKKNDDGIEICQEASHMNSWLEVNSGGQHDMPNSCSEKASVYGVIRLEEKFYNYMLKYLSCKDDALRAQFNEILLQPSFKTSASIQKETYNFLLNKKEN
jgi:hypothetical protein